MKKLLCIAVPLLALMAVTAPVSAGEKNESKDVKRARREVKMLDDVYKTAIVLITNHYVNTEEDTGAGPAAQLLFKAMKKKGWHDIRLLDASGEPIKKANLPADAFEKAAIKQLKQGKDWYEEVVETNGKRYYRAATPVPVVVKKCIMCHPNYADVKPGAAIGSLSYTLPLAD